jgi:radical SAM superfamily enzyme YgiQ (UPF0313 family)
VRLLLINPRVPESFWSFKWAVDNFSADARSVNPPLGLATLAALCPPDWEVEIVDENVESIPIEPEADIVGICGMGVQFARQTELLAYYRDSGYYVVAGGSYASLSPESYESIADSVISGEAEYIWKEFCRDFEAGRPRALYLEEGTVELADSPTPRFDLLAHQRYTTSSIQFSRGCPYRCEFCDIIVMFGRRPRTKSTAQIGAELDELRRQGVSEVFFIDDNLIGNKKAAKELLVFLRDYQRRHDYAFRIGTQASLNLAREKELMELMHEANFKWVFIGIESPDEESLKETGKVQNTRCDILSSVRTIYSHGIDVLAGFIIGFDNDTVETFDHQYRFIVDSGIQSAMVGLLLALKRTPLYERLQEEGRLIPGADACDNTKLATNIIPKRMTYDEMVAGYRDFQTRLLEFETIARRIRNKTRHFGTPPARGEMSLPEAVGALCKVVHQIATRGGVRGLYHFVRSMPLFRPRLIPLAVHDWVIGLSTRDYVVRHFSHTFDRERHLAERYLERMRKSLAGYVHRGSLAVKLDEMKNANARFSLSLSGKLGRDFFEHAAQQLERVLRDTKASLILRVEECNTGELELLRTMLERLKRYGDRIVITADNKSRRILDLDTSVFHVVMKTRGVE